MRLSMKSKFIFSISILFFLSASLVNADAEGDIEFILGASKPPKGVVFEIIEGKESKLEPALAQVNQFIGQLKAKLPDIKVAVVSHGTEQFALLKENKKSFSGTHQKVQSLVSNDVPVHVCGTHASWYGISEKDFPDYVGVAVAAPAKIREYQRQGYALIEIDVK